jgi:hypothetical protein
MRIHRTLSWTLTVTLAWTLAWVTFLVMTSCSRVAPQVLFQDNLTNTQASVLAAYTVGRPDLAHELVRITRREANGKRRGVHTRDAWASSLAWRRAVSRGYLDPTCQPNGPGWSTRGAHGLIAAYHLHLVPEVGPCAGPEVMDIPGVSALAAARKARRFPSCEGRVRAWVGAGAWRNLSTADKLRKMRRQCGAPSVIHTIGRGVFDLGKAVLALLGQFTVDYRSIKS